MSLFFRSARAPRSTLKLNQRRLTMLPRETILQAALRHGIEFPNSCRVGGCGACKCRLIAGQVRELTTTDYLLSAIELEQRTILACQSVAQTDVEIEIDLPETRRPVRQARVIRQERLTHDITQLTVQLDAPITYKSGQFAALTLEGVARNYSFATPPRPDGQAIFLIRYVPDGAFSSRVHQKNLLGHRLQVDAPQGDFWLRASEAPLLLIAGGSGLAPILALLKDALASGTSRAVTLVFGARETRDLYALGEINAIGQAWRGPFRFIPVLSAEPIDSPWSGERGLVTDKVQDLAVPDTHAYLCGPPAMIDRASTRLKSQGVAAEHIHLDRFTTHAEVAVATAEYAQIQSVPHANPPCYAGPWHYLKYSLFHVIGLLAVFALLAGGAYVTAALLSVLSIYLVGDSLSGDDVTTPTFKYPRLLTFQLWLALPLLMTIVFAALWSMSNRDPWAVGAWLSHLSGVDLLAARAGSGFGSHFSAWVLTGLMIGMIGTITAHELTHRTWDATSMLIGRWLLAFSFDTSFAIEHVYGHHRYVATLSDPATAPRGRNVYVHIVASTIRGNRSAWAIEKARLAKKRRSVASPHNAVIRGYLMSGVLVLLSYAVGGWQVAAFFVTCAFWGKALLETVNYMEHYGITRNPTTPVQPRHSWNTNKRVSSWTMFNLSRHSHHHAQGEVPFHELRPYPDAPMMLSGYLTTIVIALIPPLWQRLMAPKLAAWDRDFATPDERKLAAAANARQAPFVKLGSSH